MAGLRKDGLPAEPETIRDLVRRHLVDANDPWDLGHYRTRIPAYYTKGKNAELVGLILDALAIAQESMTVAQLQNAINTSVRGIRRQGRVGARPPTDGTRPLPDARLGRAALASGSR